jgi:hypothetical protein
MKLHRTTYYTILVIAFLINPSIAFSQVEERIKIEYDNDLDQDQIKYYVHNIFENDKLKSSYNLSNGHLSHTQFEYISKDTVLKTKYLMRPKEDNRSFEIVERDVISSENYIDREIEFSNGKIRCPCFFDNFPPQLFTINQVLKCEFDTLSVSLIRIIYNEKLKEIKQEYLKDNHFITFKEKSYDNNGNLIYFNYENGTYQYVYENNTLKEHKFKSSYDSTFRKTIYIIGNKNNTLECNFSADSSLLLSSIEEHVDSFLSSRIDFFYDSIPYDSKFKDKIPSHLFMNARKYKFNTKGNLIAKTIWKDSKIYQVYTYEFLSYFEGLFIQETCYLNGKKHYSIFHKKY